MSSIASRPSTCSCPAQARAATIHHFYIAQLAEDVVHATYRATTSVAVSHRSSLWVFRDNRWQLLFHQGTIAS
ncbi:hypothetical protein RBB78_04370 [Tunturiibacter empetritectus]|uniref:hypothetical protein n=1 Tax=Tunturiibacter empetritectus TaxID=3069691 RepID=UPI003D9BC41B